MNALKIILAWVISIEICRVERDLKRHKANCEDEISCLKDQVKSLEEERDILKKQAHQLNRSNSKSSGSENRYNSQLLLSQGYYRPWKSWKVLELGGWGGEGGEYTGPEKSLNLGCGPWKSWNRQKILSLFPKIIDKNMLLVKMFLLQQHFKTKSTNSHGLSFSNMTGHKVFRF